MSNENRVARGIYHFPNAIMLKFGALCLIALAVKKNKTRKRYSQMAGADGVARLCAAGALLKKAKQGLSFERWRLCPAGTGAYLGFSLGRLRGGRQMGAC